MHMKKHLPDWITMGTRTREFFIWLENHSERILYLERFYFVKGGIGSCMIVYGAQSGNAVESFHLMHLYCVYRLKDHALFEVAPILYRALGIPEEFCFPGKETVQMELEKKVTAQGRYQMEHAWDELLLKTKYKAKELIPAVSKEQIHMTARRYFQMGKRAKDIFYQPEFSFEKIGGFQDEQFLYYLNAEKKAVDHLVELWMQKELAQISMKRIYYSCVKEEMADMEKSRFWKEEPKNERNAGKKTA